jgi:hypothetical protein
MRGDFARRSPSRAIPLDAPGERAEREHAHERKIDIRADRARRRGLLKELLPERPILASLRGAGRDAGVAVELEVWHDMIHVWHVFAGRVPESTAAVGRIGSFVRMQVSTQGRAVAKIGARDRESADG